MSCSWSEERFERFLDGALSPHDRSALLAHVDGCDGCRSLLEELRVVDALLLEPRTVTLAENFTFATMADVRTAPAPRVRHAPCAAYAVSYLVAAWSLIGAGFLIAPGWLRASGETAIDVAHTILVSFDGIGRVAARLTGRDLSTWAAFAVGVLLFDVVLALVVTGAVRFARPRLADRLRS